MIINYIHFIRSLPRMAQSVYPEIKGAKKLRYNARFCMWSMLKPSVLRSMQKLFDQPEFHLIKDNHPRIFEKPLKPYVCLNWRPRQRAMKIHEHFQALYQMYGPNITHFYTDGGWPLIDILDCSLFLCSGPEREGSLALKLLDPTNRDLFTLAFNISTTPKREIYIGALQGPSEQITDRGEVIKSLTRGMHGLRPKALMLEVLLMLAKEWGIDTLYGITNKGHVYQALRYTGSKRSSISYQYAELWAEYGGKQVSKYMYDIPLEPARKDSSTLNKNKRRLYTKRYAWLDKVREDVHYKSDSIMIYK
ncbi:VirK/YbjX family protein [Vibrio sp.]|uniref:VirK/YbjX family protein n=1 Tax=Vibrio sp. TaxID=678 RepID=UPI00311E8EFF